jgi:excinuclease ABC subunit A
VSGSGKTTLVREVLLPLLTEQLASVTPGNSTGAESADDGDEGKEEREASTRLAATLSGAESLGRVVLVDQSALGKTPRSNPAVYIGAFEDLRELFAQSETARQRGLKDSAFSFNSAQGQCERCRGAGFEKIEMQFLSDVFIRCPDCGGRRYRSHILEVKVSAGTADWSIADLLEATVDRVVEFLAAFPNSKPAQRASASLKLLQEVGLGYLRLGQPINTLSGGESQRLKLVRHLAEFAHSEAKAAKPTLFLFDEPTTGLHFDDVRVLLLVFQRLVDAGHSVIVIEHNLDVIKCADWLIDLGPDAGDEGGRIVVCGTPETVAACKASHTGKALKSIGL